MRNTWELYRFFTPMFLHADIGHLFGNIIGQLIIGSTLEADMGHVNFLILYLLSGMGGILFSALASDTCSMGASTAVFGLLGSYIAHVILNYNALRLNSDRFCRLGIFFFLAFFFSLMLGSSKVSN